MKIIKVIHKVAKTQGSHLEFGKTKNSEMVSWKQRTKNTPPISPNIALPFQLT
jgi:hypothetical protein